MEVVHIVLRLVHIVAAVAWMGLGFTAVIAIGRADQLAGQAGFPFMKVLLTRTPYGMLFGVAAGITVLAGILLYLIANSASYFSTTGNIVLGIGAVAGLLAMGHGGSTVSRATTAYAQALAQHVGEDGSIAPENLPLLRDLSAKMNQHARISVGLMTIALIGMGLARYL